MIKGGSIRMEKNLKHTVLDIGDWQVNIIYMSKIYTYMYLYLQMMSCKKGSWKQF